MKNSGLFVVIIFIASLGFWFGSVTTENRQLAATSQGNVQNQPGGTNIGNSAPQKPGDFDTSSLLWRKGSQDPVVILVKFSDFDCPFCQSLHDTLNQIAAEYPDDVQIVMQHFPLPSHPNAQKLAELSECIAEAGGEEAFWKFADIYFGRARDGVRSSLADAATLAEQSGVDGAAAAECMNSGKMAERVRSQAALGERMGVSGTPATLVLTQDGVQELISGALPITQFQSIVDKYL